MEEPRAFAALHADQVRILTSIFERMFPADSTSPGASEMGVVEYLDRALAGIIGVGASRQAERQGGGDSDGQNNRSHTLLLLLHAPDQARTTQSLYSRQSRSRVCLKRS